MPGATSQYWLCREQCERPTHSPTHQIVSEVCPNKGLDKESPQGADRDSPEEEHLTLVSRSQEDCLEGIPKLAFEG